MFRLQFDVKMGRVFNQWKKKKKKEEEEEDEGEKLFRIGSLPTVQGLNTQNRTAVLCALRDINFRPWNRTNNVP